MNREVIDSSQWVDKYADMLFRFTLVRVKDEDQAEEIVQNTFLAALQSQGSFAGLSSEKTWLFGILKHKIMDHFRKVSKEKTSDLEMDDDRDPCESEFDGKGHWQALPIRWGINPEKAAENRELVKILETCMDKLSAKFRQIFVLREIEGLQSETICAEFGISPNNLWVMLHRTRNQLKKCLEVHLFEKDPNG
ncbi:MAG: RNA polymerase sigma factor [Nitrospinaceae bacterium]|nr:MAG: RNA polymerase sigma factor [Nitrospinaceae bacterium]